jgi:hypothetical protein
MHPASTAAFGAIACVCPPEALETVAKARPTGPGAIMPLAGSALPRYDLASPRSLAACRNVVIRRRRDIHDNANGDEHETCQVHRPRYGADIPLNSAQKARSRFRR